ncbi:MAG: ATP-binding protein [Candidatus Latescibacteria bacterium]|nr:ATP-binding protein [Candidatus Latescibacterota bacterium]
MKLVASRLECMGVGITLLNHSDQVLSIFTEDYGQSHHTAQKPAGAEIGGDIVVWAIEQGVLAGDSGGELIGIPSFFSAQSSMMVPVKQLERTVGAVYIQSEHSDAFDNYDRLIFEFLASQINIAHEKSCQLNLERKKTEYLSLVSDVGRNITGVLTVPELSCIVTDLIHQHFSYSVVALFLCDPVRPVLILKGLSDPYKDGGLPVFEQPNDQGVLGDVFQSATPHLTNSPGSNQFVKQPFGKIEDTRSELCVPVHVSSRGIGVIYIQNTDEGRLFDEVDELAMTALSGQVGIALDNARLFQDLKQSMEDHTRLQEQLVQSEKLSALGQLVAGVIHEINNPLTSVIGYTDLEIMRGHEGQTLENLNRIAQDSRRMVGIVRNLLAFARKEKPVRESVNLNHLLNDIIRIRTYHFRASNIKVIEDYDADLPATFGDPNQLRQVLLNIVTNSEQAIRKGHSQGTIWITTSEIENDNDPYIHVVIQDSGSGIAASNMSKISDPFYTTKKAGKGTGLGLSISYGIIQEHGGRLWVESSPNQGAIFRIEIPVQTEEVMSESNAPAESAHPEISPKKILVVDDEQEIGGYLLTALVRLGHDVDTAIDGEAAWHLISQKRYDLILTDLKMPGITGFKLYNLIKEKHPDLLKNILVMTGDIINQEALRFFDETGVPYIEKPFTLKQLERAIAAVVPPSQK